MHPFHNASIKKRLTMANMLASSAALLLACLAFVAYELIAFRQQMRNDLSTLAQIIGDNSTASLLFGDPASAEETLGALKAEPNIASACIYSHDDALFAQYVRQDAQAVSFPAKPEIDGYRYEHGYLVQFHQIVLNGEKIGTIYLRSDLNQLKSRLWRYAGIVGCVFVASGLLALVLSA